MKRLIFALLGILALTGSLSAIIAYNDTSTFNHAWLASNGGWNWQALAMIAVMACLFANALVYMIGYALQMENVKRFAKVEFFHVTASAIMIVTIVAVLDGVLQYTVQNVIGADSVAICNGQQYKIFDYSGGPISYIYCKVDESASELEDCYAKTYASNYGTERTASTCASIKGIPVYCGDWFMHTEVEGNHLTGYKITPLLVNLYGQKAALSYIAENMLAVFLPLGLLLRVFPFLRGIGGLLIAIALGFYFVFPVVYLMNDPTFVKQATPSIPNVAQDPSFSCYPGFKGAATILTIPTLSSTAGGGISDTCTNAPDLIARITINLMFYPFVALAATLIFIRTAASLLGGDSGEIMRMVSKVI